MAIVLRLPLLAALLDGLLVFQVVQTLAFQKISTTGKSDPLRDYQSAQPGMCQQL